MKIKPCYLLLISLVCISCSGDVVVPDNIKGEWILQYCNIINRNLSINWDIPLYSYNKYQYKEIKTKFKTADIANCVVYTYDFGSMDPPIITDYRERITDELHIQNIRNLFNTIGNTNIYSNIFIAQYNNNQIGAAYEDKYCVYYCSSITYVVTNSNNQITYFEEKPLSNKNGIHIGILAFLSGYLRYYHNDFITSNFSNMILQ